MSLRPIPIEKLPNAEPRQGKKSFNPPMAKRSGSSLKELCLRLIRFINRGGRYTVQQIDEIIMTLHRSILHLQKEKREILIRKFKKKER